MLIGHNLGYFQNVEAISRPSSSWAGAGRTVTTWLGRGTERGRTEPGPQPVQRGKVTCPRSYSTRVSPPTPPTLPRYSHHTPGELFICKIWNSELGFVPFEAGRKPTLLLGSASY